MNRKHIRLLALVLTFVLLAAAFALRPVYAEETTDGASTVDETTTETTESDQTTFEDNDSETALTSNDIWACDGTINSGTNIFVSVGYRLNITNLDGELTCSGEKDIADVTFKKPETGGITVSITGVKEGTTTITVGETNYTVYVVPYPYNEKNHNSKTATIKVDKIENCDVYAVINGKFFDVNDIGVFMDQTFVGPLSVVFFAAPHDDYALAQMTSTGSLKQYYTISDGDEYGVGSDAWPLTDLELEDAPSDEKDSAWKEGSAGFKNQLTEGPYSLTSLKELFAEALKKNCDGALAFAKRYDKNDLDTSLTFIAEKMPTLTKSITGYKLSTDEEGDDWRTYNESENPELRVGAKLQYTFTIERNPTEDVKYSNVWLTDDKIGFKMQLTYDENSGKLYGYEDGVAEGTLKYDWNNSTEKLEITTEYTINKDHAHMYSGGSFTNSATLSYNYQSKYSSGSHEMSKSSEVNCKILGIATYRWKSSLPAVIQSLTLPASHEFVANKVAHVSNQMYDDQITNEDGIWTKWTFNGWNFSEDGSETKFYKPGEKIEVTNEYTVNATLVGHWESENLTPHSVTYTWEGLPSDENCENEHPQVPTDGNEYYETQTYTVDGAYQKGSTYNHGDEVYVFSGWKLGNDVVSGELTMGNSDVELKGTWTKQSDLTDLTIQVSGCDETLDENQTFLFRVACNGIDMMTVTVHGNGSTTISGLEVGETYTVTQLTDWSWRYTTAKKEKSVKLTTGENEVKFEQNRANTKWLDGNTFWNILSKNKKEGA